MTTVLRTRSEGLISPSTRGRGYFVESLTKDKSADKNLLNVSVRRHSKRDKLEKNVWSNFDDKQGPKLLKRVLQILKGWGLDFLFSILSPPLFVFQLCVIP